VAHVGRTLVAVNSQGRVTLPADVRRKLHIAGGSQLEVGVEGDRVTLRPAHVVPAEDAWAYTPENLAGLRRALENVRAGRVYRVAMDELDRIVGTGTIPPRFRRNAAARKAAKRKSA